MSIFGSAPKTNIAAEQEAAAARERERLAREQAEAQAISQSRSAKKMAETESRRRAFAGQLAEMGSEESGKRRYLQAV